MATNAELTEKVKQLEEQLNTAGEGKTDNAKFDEVNAELGNVRLELEKVKAELEDAKLQLDVEPVEVGDSVIDQVKVNYQAEIDHIGDGQLSTGKEFVYVGVIGFNGDEGYRRDPIRDRVLAIAKRAIDDRQIGSLDNNGEQTFANLPNFKKTNRIRVVVCIEETK